MTGKGYYHGFLGPKSDLALLNNRKRSFLIAKQIYSIVTIVNVIFSNVVSNSDIVVDEFIILSLTQTITESIDQHTCPKKCFSSLFHLQILKIEE